MFGISGTELFIIIVFVMVVFGPDKLPQIGRTVGQFMREFKRAQESMEAIIRAEVYASENKPSPSNTADMDDAEIFEESPEDAGDGDAEIVNARDEGADDAGAHDEGADDAGAPAESAEGEPPRKSPFDNVAPEPETADEEDEV